MIYLIGFMDLISSIIFDAPSSIEQTSDKAVSPSGFQTDDRVSHGEALLICDSLNPCERHGSALTSRFWSSGMKRGYQRTGNPFIKRFRHVQTVQFRTAEVALRRGFRYLATVGHKSRHLHWLCPCHRIS